MSSINESIVVRFNSLIITAEEADEVAARLQQMLRVTGSGGIAFAEASGISLQGAWEISYSGTVRYPQLGNSGNFHTIELEARAGTVEDHTADVIRTIVAMRDECLRNAYRDALRSVSNDIARLNVDEVNAGDMMDHLKAILEAFPNTN